MKRLLVGLAAAVALFAVAAPVGTAAPATAVIDVVFSDDGNSATISSTKGVSNYVVTLCDGTSFKVELSGDDREVTVGPFSSPIASITVKSATSVYTENSGKCDQPPPPCDPKLDPGCEPPPPPCDPKDDKCV